MRTCPDTCSGYAASWEDRSVSLMEVVAAVLLVLGSVLVLRAVWVADFASEQAAASSPRHAEPEESLRRAA